MKLRTIGMTVVAAIALVAGRVQAQDAAPAPAAAPAAGEDAGWNTKYGVLFALPNLFQNGSSMVVDGYDPGDNGAKVGFQYNLGAQTALRLSVDLTRTSRGITENSGPGTASSKVVPAETSFYSADLKAQYLLRMTTASFSPYAGAGVGLFVSQSNKKGKDETNGVVTTEYDNYNRDFDFGLNGTLGVEWRIHKYFALFAEYEADLTLISTNHEKTKVTTAAGTSETESKRKEFLNLNVDIAQGGRLGFLAFF